MEMVNENHERKGSNELTVTFNFASKMLVHNLEVAALMSEDAENDGNTLAGGVSSSLGFVEKKVAKKLEKKQKQDFANMLLRIHIQKTIEQINEIIRYHFEQIELLLEQIEENQKILDDLDRQEEALRKALEKFQQTGVFELDEDGRLANKYAEVALRKYEEQTGQKIDRDDPVIYEIMLEALIKVEQGREQTRLDIEQKTKHYEYHKTQKEKAEAIKEALESGDPDRCERALSDLENLEIPQQFEIARSVEQDNPDYEVHKLTNESVGLTEENTSNENFSFGFPSLKDDFSKAKTGENKKEAFVTKKELPTKSLNTFITKP